MNEKFILISSKEKKYSPLSCLLNNTLFMSVRKENQSFLLFFKTILTGEKFVSSRGGTKQKRKKEKEQKRKEERQ